MDVFHTNFEHVANYDLVDTIMRHVIIDENKSDRIIGCNGEDITISVGN